jgi:hypothetical protein
MEVPEMTSLLNGNASSHSHLDIDQTSIRGSLKRRSMYDWLWTMPAADSAAFLAAAILIVLLLNLPTTTLGTPGVDHAPQFMGNVYQVQSFDACKLFEILNLELPNADASIATDNRQVLDPESSSIQFHGSGEQRRPSEPSLAESAQSAYELLAQCRPELAEDWIIDLDVPDPPDTTDQTRLLLSGLLMAEYELWDESTYLLHERLNVAPDDNLSRLYLALSLAKQSKIELAEREITRLQSTLDCTDDSGAAKVQLPSLISDVYAPTCRSILDSSHILMSLIRYEHGDYESSLASAQIVSNKGKAFDVAQVLSANALLALIQTTNDGTAKDPYTDSVHQLFERYRVALSRIENSATTDESLEAFLAVSAALLWSAPEFYTADANRQTTDAAVDILCKNIAARPRDPRLRGNLGVLLKLRGEAEDAVRALTTAILLDPGNTEWLYHLANAADAAQLPYLKAWAEAAVKDPRTAGSYTTIDRTSAGQGSVNEPGDFVEVLFYGREAVDSITEMFQALMTTDPLALEPAPYLPLPCETLTQPTDVDVTRLLIPDEVAPAFEKHPEWKYALLDLFDKEASRSYMAKLLDIYSGKESKSSNWPKQPMTDAAQEMLQPFKLRAAIEVLDRFDEALLVPTLGASLIKRQLRVPLSKGWQWNQENACRRLGFGKTQGCPPDTTYFVRTEQGLKMHTGFTHHAGEIQIPVLTLTLGLRRVEASKEEYAAFLFDRDWAQSSGVVVLFDEPSVLHSTTLKGLRLVPDNGETGPVSPWLESSMVPETSEQDPCTQAHIRWDEDALDALHISMDHHPQKYEAGEFTRALQEHVKEYMGAVDAPDPAYARELATRRAHIYLLDSFELDTQSGKDKYDRESLLITRFQHPDLSSSRRNYRSAAVETTIMHASGCLHPSATTLADKDKGHGHHVLGIINAKQNHFGIVGLFPGALVKSWKPRETLKPTWSDVDVMLRRCENSRHRDRKPFILNTSFSLGFKSADVSKEQDRKPDVLQNQIGATLRDEVLIVTATTDNSKRLTGSNCNAFPACIEAPNVLKVAALSKSPKSDPWPLCKDELALEGQQRTPEDCNRLADYAPDVLFAPGFAILSAENELDHYSLRTGSSESAAMVSAAAAMLLEKSKALKTEASRFTPHEIKVRLLASAKFVRDPAPLGDFKGQSDDTTGQEEYPLMPIIQINRALNNIDADTVTLRNGVCLKSNVLASADCVVQPGTERWKRNDHWVVKPVPAAACKCEDGSFPESYLVGWLRPVIRNDGYQQPPTIDRFGTKVWEDGKSWSRDWDHIKIFRHDFGSEQWGISFINDLRRIQYNGDSDGSFLTVVSTPKDSGVVIYPHGYTRDSDFPCEERGTPCFQMLLADEDYIGEDGMPTIVEFSFDDFADMLLTEQRLRRWRYCDYYSRDGYCDDDL